MPFHLSQHEGQQYKRQAATWQRQRASGKESNPSVRESIIKTGRRKEKSK